MMPIADFIKKSGAGDASDIAKNKKSPPNPLLYKGSDAVTQVTQKNNKSEPVPSKPKTEGYRTIGLNGFLTGTGFAIPMILIGTELWQQPLSDQNLADIRQGHYTPDHIKRYLNGWRLDNPLLFIQLKVFPQDSGDIPESKDDVLMPLEGLNLLRDDRLFLREFLFVLPPKKRERILNGYREVWLAALNACNIQNNSANTARKTANSWLRTSLFN